MIPQISAATAALLGKIRGLSRGDVVDRALAEAARPEPMLTVAEWSDQRRFVAAESGSPKPGKWRNATTPFAVEIMDCLEPDHPARTVTLRIGSQMIKSEVILNWIGATIDVDPAPMMLVLPSLNEVRTWNATKWEPTRKATPCLAEKVMDQTERKTPGESSTTNFKAFRGGYLLVTTASSSKELQARSVKRAALDEISEYPEDVGGRGDPIDQVVTRADAHPDAKFLLASTPAELPNCRITKFYEAGDQRELYCPCPHCEAYQTLAFDRLEWIGDEAAMPCLACGAVLTDPDKADMLAAGVWIKRYPADETLNPPPPDHFDVEELPRWRARISAGRDPSFWLPQTYSPFKPWARLLREGAEAEAGSLEKRKTFRQQKLALAWDPAVDAPDHAKLYAVRGQHVERGVIPSWACLITGAADVQNNRIEWAAYAWGPDRSGARFDWGVCDGDTLTDQPWIDLAEVIGTRWPGETCVPLGFDAFAIDSGGGKGRTARVYAFVGRSPRVRAIKGASDSRAQPYAEGHIQRAKLRTGKMAQARVDLIGGHDVKHTIMSMLNRGADAFDAGERLSAALYYTTDAAEEHFRQLTAEVYKLPKTRRAGARGFWEKLSGRANEQLDLAVYNYALAWNEGLERWGPTEWARLMAARARQVDDAPLLNVANIQAHATALADRDARLAKDAPKADDPHTDEEIPGLELATDEGKADEQPLPAADTPSPASPPAPEGPPAAQMARNPRAGGERPAWMEKLIAHNKRAGE